MRKFKTLRVTKLVDQQNDKKVKSHFGVWKYFVHKITGENKARYFITDDCVRVPFREGQEIEKK